MVITRTGKLPEVSALAIASCLVGIAIAIYFNYTFLSLVEMVEYG